MNEDRINEAGLEEQAGPLPFRPERQTATAAAIVALVAAVVLGLALTLLGELEAHQAEDERNAAVPVRPDFGRVK